MSSTKKTWKELNVIDDFMMNAVASDEIVGEDGLYFYYFYPKGKNGGSKEIQNLLKYIMNSNEENTKEVTQNVTQNMYRLTIYELLEDLGNITENIRSRVDSETDETTLKKWHKLAAKSSSIREFEEKL